MADWGALSATAPVAPVAKPSGVDWGAVGGAAQAQAAARGVGGGGGPSALSKLNTTQKNLQAALQWAGESPAARGADAVLNAGSRFGTGVVAGKNPVGTVLDPAHATQTTHAAERNFSRFSNAIGMPALPVLDEDAEGNVKPGYSLPQYALQAFYDMGTETFTDPTMFIPGLDVYSLAKHGVHGVQGAAKLLNRVPVVKRATTAAAATPLGRGIADSADKLKASTVEFHNERKDVTPSGEGVIKDREIGGKNAQRRTETHYANLIEDHRPAIEAYEQHRNEVKAEMALLKDARDAGSATAADMYAKHEKELQDMKKLFPADVRQALLQRAYVEGTSEVRRKVMAKGYKPTTEEQASKPLNILHNFNDEYEPEQELASAAEKAEAERVRAQAPVTYLRQGNKRAKFDLPKHGGTADTPLADRLLDRLVNGSRLETYHSVRRDILDKLGLNTGMIDANMQRTLDKIEKSKEIRDSGPLQFGNTDQKRAAAEVIMYENLLKKQQAALEQAAAARAKHLQPGAYGPENLKGQQLEILDPNAAKQKVINDARRAGEPMTRIATVGPKGAQQKVRVEIKPRDQEKPVQQLRGKIMGLNSTVTNTEIIARNARRAALAADAAAQSVHGGKMAQATVREAQRAGATSTRRAGADLANTAEARAAAAKGLGVQAPVVVHGPDGVIIHPTQTANTFNDSKLVGPTGAPISSKPAPKTGAERKLAAVEAPLEKINARSLKAANTASTPFQRILAAQQADATRVGKKVSTPVLQHMMATEQRKQKAVLRLEQHQRRLNDRLTENANIKTIQQHGADIAQAVNTVPIPKHIHDRLFGEIPKYTEGLASTFADLQRDALFVIPFAHMKNIAVLTALGPGGIGTVKSGMNYAKRLKAHETAPDPELTTRIADLEKRGATEHYIQDTPQAYASWGKAGAALGDFADRGNRSLERWDMGMRLALEDELRKKGTSDEMLGSEIRSVLGDYTNQAPAIRFLRTKMGASFPNWGFGVVPRAMTKAVREQPKAVKQYARSQRLISDDVTQPTMGVNFDFGGPFELYSHMIEEPLKVAGSPSRMGLPMLIPGAAGAAAYGELPQYLGEEASHMVPGSAIASSALGWPFSSNAPAAVRGALGLAGIYTKNRKRAQQRANELYKLGLKGEQVHEILQREGYEPQRQAPEQQAPPGNVDWSALSR